MTEIKDSITAWFSDIPPESEPVLLAMAGMVGAAAVLAIISRLKRGV